MKVIRLSDVIVKSWSGGTTAELLIYPEGSSFAAGNFELRISLATVAQETSVFTPLPGTNRTLLVLKGTQLLKHRGHHTADLKPLEQDTFSGDWTTQCSGTATNFNVMTHSDKVAKVEVVDLGHGNSLQSHTSATVQFLYLLEGTLIAGQQTIISEEGIVFNKETEIRAKENARMVLVSYRFKSNS